MSVPKVSLRNMTDPLKPSGRCKSLRGNDLSRFESFFFRAPAQDPGFAAYQSCFFAFYLQIGTIVHHDHRVVLEHMIIGKPVVMLRLAVRNLPRNAQQN